MATAEPSLEDISGLSGICGELEGPLTVVDSPHIDNLDAFECLSGATAVNIAGNAELKSVQGLKNMCGKLQGGLGVQGNPLLDNLDGLALAARDLLYQGEVCALAHVRFQLHIGRALDDLRA